MWCPPWFPKMHVKVLWSNSEHATPEDLNKIQRSVFMYSMHCYEHFAGSISTAFKGLLLKDLLKHYYLCWKISFFYNAVKTLVSLGWPKSEVGEWSRYQPDLWYFSPYLVILCSCIWLPRIVFYSFAKIVNYYSCREVWGLLCINSTANLRSNLLHLVWHRRWVKLPSFVRMMSGAKT